MSASEKLRKLEMGITAGEWRANEHYPSSLTVGGLYSFSGRMRTEADARFCATIANVFPQIIRMVEAVEARHSAFVGEWRGQSYVMDEEDRALIAALIALEEAL